MQEQADQSPQPQPPESTPTPEPAQAPHQESFDDAVASAAKALETPPKAPAVDPPADDVPSEKKPEPEAPKEEDADKSAPAQTPKPSAWASLRKREQDLVEKQNTWSKEREELQAKATEVERLRARAKDDPFEALKQLGYEDPRKFLEQIAETGGRLTPEQKRIAELEATVQADRAERDKLRTEAEERAQQQRAEEQTKHWHSEIGKFVRGDAELKDGLASAPGVEPAIFQVMQAHYAETEEQMPFKDAAKIVEKQLEERVTSMLNDIVANKRGREVFDTIAAKLNKPAPASKKAPPGITQSISNSTSAKRARPARFEEALDGAASWLNSQMK